MEEVSESSEVEEKSGDELSNTTFLASQTSGGTLLRQRKPSSRFTLSAASKMLRKKIPQSGLLMFPRRLWMQTVPTNDCEVVILFSCSVDEPSIDWLVNCFKARIPELVLIVKNHLAVNSLALYATATIDGLVKGAEDIHLLKKTKPEYGNAFRELNRDELNIFQGIEDPSTFFTTQERQFIVLHLLNSLRGLENEKVAGIEFRVGQAIVPKLQSDGIIEQILPLHDYKLLAKLRTCWVQSFFRYQPLDQIQEYFGSKIGIYFSWLGFYTASLTVPAVIGLIFWIKFWGKDEILEDKAFVVIAFLNVVWGSMWLEAWKRRSAELTHKWGLTDHCHEMLQDPRPCFQGELTVSPVTGRVEPTYPIWKRNLCRYFITLPVVFSCLVIVFIVMFTILKFQEWLDEVIEYRGLPALLSYGPKFIMAVMISILDEGYAKIAVWLNNIENYRREETYQNHLIIKLAIFRLVNSFLVLFYIAFYLQDMETLKAQLAALFVTRQIVGNIKESCIPYILEQLRVAKLSFDIYGNLSPTTEEKKWEEHKKTDSPSTENCGEEPEMKKEETKSEAQSSPVLRTSSKSRIVSQAEIESNMATYEDTFEDYLEMFIQFGYVMLFSSAFPLAATCAFVNNLIEIRSDAFKLCSVFQRPFGQRVRSIGVWQDAMEFMCLLGIMVNCMLIGLSGQVHRMFPEMTSTQTILLIVVLEHIMIALKYGISYMIPDEPVWVSEEIAKAEFRRREALRKLSSTSPPTREGSGQSSPKSCPMSNVSSMEYVEQSVQTDVDQSNFSKKFFSKTVEEEDQTSIKTDKEKVSKGSSMELIEEDEGKRDPIEKLKEFSIETSSSVLPPKSFVKLDRSFSMGGEPFSTKPVTPPKKKWNQSCLDNSQFSQFLLRESGNSSGEPSPAESLPLLSAPADYSGNKKLLFNFGIEKGNLVPKEAYTPSPEMDSIASSGSKSSESFNNASTLEMITPPIKKELIISKKETDSERLLVSSQSREKMIEKDTFSPSVISKTIRSSKENISEYKKEEIIPTKDRKSSVTERDAEEYSQRAREIEKLRKEIAAVTFKTDKVSKKDNRREAPMSFSFKEADFPRREKEPSSKKESTGIVSSRRDSGTSRRESGTSQSSRRESGTDGLKRDLSFQTSRRESGGESSRRESGTDSFRKDILAHSSRRESGSESSRRESGVDSIKRDSFSPSSGTESSRIESGASDGSRSGSSDREAKDTPGAVPKIGKRHPVKFLKRAQSFSQVFSNFKKPPTSAVEKAEKKKRQLDSIRDDYGLTISREPLGELALIPLEKLISVEGIMPRTTTNN